MWFWIYKKYILIYIKLLIGITIIQHNDKIEQFIKPNQFYFLLETLFIKDPEKGGRGKDDNLTEERGAEEDLFVDVTVSSDGFVSFSSEIRRGGRGGTEALGTGGSGRNRGKGRNFSLTAEERGAEERGAEEDLFVDVTVSSDGFVSFSLEIRRGGRGGTEALGTGGSGRNRGRGRNFTLTAEERGAEEDLFVDVTVSCDVFVPSSLVI
jgi:uncharacterized protein YuzE